jgi:hypothetical protein
VSTQQAEGRIYFSVFHQGRWMGLIAASLNREAPAVQRAQTAAKTRRAHEKNLAEF